MSEQVLTSPYLKVGTTNLSAYVQSLKINRAADMQEFTTGNPSGSVVYKRRLVGVIDFSIEIELSDDFAGSGPHQALSALFGTTFPVEAATNGSTPSDSNEVVSFTGTFDNLNSGGQVGTHLMKTLNIYLASGVPTFATS